jgi:hypothetical protein
LELFGTDPFNPDALLLSFKPRPAAALEAFRELFLGDLDCD